MVNTVSKATVSDEKVSSMSPSKYSCRWHEVTVINSIAVIVSHPVTIRLRCRLVEICALVVDMNYFKLNFSDFSPLTVRMYSV